uniref:Uncharacterized protein n=1 Tax=Candidatus Kentrum sp. FM TaxID=2126340 RepID=A0A450W3F4_9GAMM|nr:MAG: hypothetical protein BECKFM1743A_GA0114220_101755 [Candidatus Kentron sp. FM]VFJ56881.1 MAG: hypothetical protein BECKFM1743C_GA0114222_101873 [Candidatus Kentron sp. FM]VFK11496.1 MAG: hypothetical protein BECKFM1743B_GA0114221_101863 [Candidatus Kentron sp. FM]
MNYLIPNKTTLLLLVALFLLLSGSCKATSASYQTYDTDVFLFEIATDWRPMDGRLLHVFRKQYEQQSAELYEEYHSGLEDFDTGVPFLAAFNSPGMEATLVALRMKIPPQASDYINKSIERFNKIIRWGKQTGRVRQVHRNNLLSIDGASCHNSDLGSVDISPRNRSN